MQKAVPLLLKEVSGDILLSKAAAIVHGVAPRDDFKQGLALSLRERWPSMYQDFHHYCHNTSPKPGSLWTWQGVGGFICINLLTQEAPASHGQHPGHATLENVHHALKELEKEVKRLNLKSLAITRLGTGVGGLDWKDVKPLIEKHLGHLSIPVYVYSTYHKGVAADES